MQFGVLIILIDKLDGYITENEEIRFQIESILGCFCWNGLI